MGFQRAVMMSVSWAEAGRVVHEDGIEPPTDRV